MRPYAIAAWGVWHEEESRKRAIDNVAAGRTQVIELSGVPIGVLRVERTAACIEVKQIFLLPEHQRCGIGSELILRLIDEAKEAKVPLRLRVLNVNPAQRLYKRLGFFVVRSTTEHQYMEWTPSQVDARVELVPYDSSWPSLFGQERAVLERVLAKWLVGPVEHIGSTAVPGLIAKPVIDIMAAVESLPAALPAIAAATEAGYAYYPYRPDVMHWFCKPSAALRTHHLHLVPFASELWNERLAFRDCLRSSPSTATEYAELKRHLAAQFEFDREGYTDAKAPFVQRVTQEAMARRMEIRKAETNEAQALSALVLESKAHWGYSAQLIESWGDQLRVTPADVVSRPTYVGTVNGEIAGFYSLRPGKGDWELDNLWVAPKHMRRGRGRTLLDHALDVAFRGGASSVLVDADPNAESFYLSCGAARSGHVPAPIPGQPDRVRPQLVFKK